jgi:hypothetical protein
MPKPDFQRCELDHTASRQTRQLAETIARTTAERRNAYPGTPGCHHNRCDHRPRPGFVQLRAPVMPFPVRIDVRVPHDVDAGKIERLNAREHERAQEPPA